MLPRKMTPLNRGPTVRKLMEACGESCDDRFALVPFSYASPFHDALRLEERLFDLGVGRMVRVRQAWKNDGRGGSVLGFGASVYDGSFVLSHFLAHNSEIVRDQVVVELGAGLGLASIAASLAGARFVACTDGDRELLKLAEENLAVNAPDAVKAGSLMTVPLLWADRDNMRDLEELLQEKRLSPTLPPCDVVIAADVAACVYEDAFEYLHETMRWLCDECGAKSIITAYRRRHHSEDAFFEKVSETFEVSVVPAEKVHADFRSDERLRLLMMTRRQTAGETVVKPPRSGPRFCC